MKKLFLLLIGILFVSLSCEKDEAIVNDLLLKEKVKQLLSYKSTGSKNSTTDDFNWKCGNQPTDWLGYPTGSTIVGNYNNYDGTTTTLIVGPDDSVSIVSEAEGLLWCQSHADWTEGPFWQWDNGN